MGKLLGTEKIYNKSFEKRGINSIIRWDILKIKNEQELLLEFISVNSTYRQGVRIAIDVGQGYLEINGVQAKAMQLWQDTSPQKVKIKCSSSEGVISIYNLYDLGKGRGGVRSQTDSCGMIVKHMDGKVVYSCNDVGFNTEFDKLVFQIVLQ